MYFRFLFDDFEGPCVYRDGAQRLQGFGIMLPLADSEVHGPSPSPPLHRY